MKLIIIIPLSVMTSLNANSIQSRQSGVLIWTITNCSIFKNNMIYEVFDPTSCSILAKSYNEFMKDGEVALCLKNQCSFQPTLMKINPITMLESESSTSQSQFGQSISSSSGPSNLDSRSEIQFKSQFEQSNQIEFVSEIKHSESELGDESLVDSTDTIDNIITSSQKPLIITSFMELMLNEDSNDTAAIHQLLAQMNSTS